MSGVVIDVVSQSSAAQADLKSLNAQLSNLVKSSNSLNSTIGNTAGLKSFNKEAANTGGILKNMGTVGSRAFNTMLVPVNALRSALFSTTTAVTGLVGAVVAFKGFHEFSKAGDDLLRVQNRLKLVSDTTYDVIKLQGSLYDISRKTWTGLESSADIYFNLARAMSKVGESQESMLAMTKTIQQTIAVSGVGSQTAAAALVQLNQGLSSGTLRGEELNSVLEQLPRLGLALTESLKMSAGQLRLFAEQGNLTTKIVTDVLKEQAKAIDSEFSKTTMTAAQGFTQLANSAKYLLGTLNMMENSSKRWGGWFNKMASGIDVFTADMVPQFYIITQGIRNYIADLDRFKTYMLVFRAFMKSDISIFDVKKAYDEYGQAKTYLAKVRDLFGRRNEIKKDAKSTIMGIEVPTFSAKKAELPTLTLRENLERLSDLAKAAGHAISGLFSKFHWLIPDIRIPLRTIDNVLDKWFRQTETDVNAWSREWLKPYQRAIEAVYEFTNAFTRGDTALERSWARLFKADSVEGFTSALRDLGDTARDIRFADFSILGNDVKSVSRSVIEDGKAILRFFNIIDNRVLFINNIRFDRLIGGLKTLSSVVKRIYDDIFYPVVAPAAAAVYLYVEGAFQALRDAIIDNFSGSTGERIGTALVKGIVGAFGTLADFIKTLFKNVSDGKFSITPDSDMSGFVSGFKKAVVSIIEWLKGVFKGAMTQMGLYFGEMLLKIGSNAFSGAFKAMSGDSTIANVLSEYLEGVYSRDFKFKFNLDPSALEEALHTIDLMFAVIITSAYNMATKVERRMGVFADNVKGFFFDIYDAVVGHSYWPDTIDGVLEYTDNIFGAETKMDKFKDKIISVFKGIRDAFNNNKGKLGDFVANVSLKLESIDYGSLGHNLKQVLTAALVAAVMYAFGGTFMKIVSVDFFLSTFSDGILAVVHKAPDELVSAIGTSAGIIGATISSSIINGLNLVLNALPKFVSTFLQSLGPITGVFGALLDFGPSNKLVYAFLGGLAIYLLKAKDAMGSLKRIMTGIGKKPKAEVKVGDGIADYAKSIFNLKGPSQLGIMYTALLGANPHLLLAGLAVISTAYLESISIMEAASIGVPLLLFAILGRDAGGRAIRETVTRLIPNLVGGIYDFLHASAAKYKATSWLTSVFPSSAQINSGISAIIGGIKTPRSAIASAVGNVGADIVTIMRNVQRNSADYGKNAISFTDMLFKDNTMGPVANRSSGIVTSVKKVFEEIGKIKLGNNTLSGLKTSLATAIPRLATGLSGNVTTALSPIWVSIKKNFGLARIVAADIWKQMLVDFGSYVALMKDGLKGLATFVTSKLGVFLLLAAGFVSIASAATSFESAGTGISGMLSSIIVNLTKMVALLAVAGVAFRAFGEFKTGKSGFVRNIAEQTRIDPATIAAGKSAFKKTFDALKSQGLDSDADITNAAMTAKTGTINKIVDDAEAAARKSSGAFKAGMESMNAYLISVGKQIGAFFQRVGAHAIDAAKYLKDLAERTIFREEFWISAWNYVSTFGARSKAAFVSLGKSIADVAIAMKTLFAGGVIAGLKAVKDTYSAAGSAAAASLVFGQKLGGALATAGKWLFRIGAIILSVKGAVVAATVSAAGALGLWLFGPGDGFLENLEWAKDKIMSVFGVIEKGDLSRRINLKDKLKDAKVGDETFSLDTKVDMIDMAKVTEHQYKVLKDATDVTADTIARMKDMYVLQGSLTNEQLNELKAAVAQQERLMSSMPQSSATDINKASGSMLEDLSYQDNSLIKGAFRLIGSMFNETFVAIVDSPLVKEGVSATGRVLGAIWEASKSIVYWATLIGPIYDGWSAIFSWIKVGVISLGHVLSGVWDGMKIAAKLAFKEIRDVMFPPISGDRKIRKDLANEKYQNVARVQGYLKDPEKRAFAQAQRDYGTAEKAYQEKLTGGLFSARKGEGLKQYNRELAELKKNSEEAEKKFLSMADALERQGIKTRNIQMYSQYLDSLIADSKEFLGIDFGKGGVDLIGGADAQGQFRAYADSYKEMLDRLKAESESADTAVEIRIDMLKVKNQAKELQDYLNSTVFFDNKLDYELKLSGTDASKEQLADMFAYSNGQYKEWEANINEIRNQVNLINGLFAKNANPEHIKLAYEELFRLKKKAVDLAPDNGYFAGVNKELQKFSKENLTESVFISSTKEGIDNIKAKLKEASKLKYDFERAASTGKPFEQQIAALQEMVIKLREIDQILSLNKRQAFGKAIDQENTNQGKARVISEYGGPQIPANVAANETLTKKWIAAQEKLMRSKSLLTSFSTTDSKFKAENASIRKLEKQIANIEEERPDRTASVVLSEISSMSGIGSFKTLYSLPEDIREKLISAAKTVADKEYLMTKSGLSDKQREQIGNELHSLKKLGADISYAYAPKSMNDKLSSLTNLGLSVDDKNFSKLSDKYAGVANLYNAQSRVLEDKDATEAEKLLALKITNSIKRSFVSIGIDESSLSTKLSWLSDLLPGVETSVDMFRRSSTEYGIILVEQAADIKKMIAELDAVKDDPAAYRRKLVEMKDKRDKAYNDLLLNDSNQPYASRVQNRLSGTGVSAPGNINVGSEVLLKTVDELSRQIRTASKRIDDDPNMRDSVRVATEREIEILREQLAEALRKGTMAAKDTQAAQYATSFASGMADAIGTSIKDVLTGKKSLIEGIGELATSLSEQMTNAFVDGMMAAVKKNWLDPMFKQMGASIFQSGANLFGGVDEPDVIFSTAVNQFVLAVQQFSGGAAGTGLLKGSTDPSSVDYVNEMDKASDSVSKGVVKGTDTMTFRLGDTLTKGWNDLTRVLGEAWSGLGSILRGAWDALKGVFSGIGSMFSGTGGGFGSLFTNSNGTGGLGSLWTSVGSGLTDLPFIDVLGMFAGGGSVFGAGTSTSDSIPAMLSNGEFVVRAQQAARFRPMLEAINSGRIPKFAAGGDVGIAATSKYEPLTTMSSSTKSEQIFNINITGDVSRQTRTEIQRMIPQIATGVDMHKREKGNR